MGTRAIITKNRHPFLATHWDGDPLWLGKALLDVQTDEKIIAVAMRHTIDCAHASVQKPINELRLRDISQRHNISLTKVRKGLRRGGICGPEDYAVGNIADYDDYAEWQYDFTNGNWRARWLDGCWKQSKKGKWQPLSELIEELEQPEAIPEAPPKAVQA